MNELILIVDDEPGILEAMHGILDDEGYRTIVTTSGDEALRLFEVDRPDVVFLDIWLPDRDGLETLQAIRRIDPHAAVVMMSGHGTSATAVRSIKMGAHDYLEKPLSYDQTLQAIRSALDARSSAQSDAEVLEASRDRVEPVREFPRPAELTLLSETSRPQRTLATSMVIYGLGLHSGSRTGMVLQPLPPDTGIHFLTLPRGVVIPAHVNSVADTEYATTLTGHGESIRTVEHLMSALHAAGISNLMVKVHGEIPVLDGSALEFCTRLEEVGIVDQDAPSREIVIDRTFEIATGSKRLVLEPWDRFRVSYQLSYPPPVGDQFFDFELESFASYKAEVAPARTFGFMRDMKMINELGLGSGGRLDNFILVGEDDVVNTELRFPDEFVRHKVLDIIGDLYLLGYPIRGRVTAALTGHRDNIQLQREILKATAVG
jgi:UDP-3-O-acyl N-acetylglucosamine deacetylase